MNTEMDFIYFIPLCKANFPLSFKQNNTPELTNLLSEDMSAKMASLFNPNCHVR